MKYRIGEVCKMYNVSADTLRYYDEIGLLKPDVDIKSGYRYYRMEHLDILEMILVGRYIEIPLKDMKDSIISEDLENYRMMVEKQKKKILEKREYLDMLDNYTAEMLVLLDEIKDYNIDPNNIDVKSVLLSESLHKIDIDHLNQKNENYNFVNVEQWFLYRCDSNGSLIADNDTVFLALNNDEKGTHILRGVYSYLTFKGTESAIENHLMKLIKEHNLHTLEIYIKYRLALLQHHQDHEYYVDIYYKN